MGTQQKINRVALLVDSCSYTRHFFEPRADRGKLCRSYARRRNLHIVELRVILRLLDNEPALRQNQIVTFSRQKFEPYDGPGIASA
jgi:hypothetical protein